MTFYNVISSNINSIGYDIEKMELVVEFKRGIKYKYFKVYPEVVTNLLFSESVGKFFNQYIKDGYKNEVI